jgi:hypothetical protein
MMTRSRWGRAVRAGIFVCVFIGCALAARTAALATDSVSPAYAQNAARYESMVGKDYWINPVFWLSFCTEPVLFGDCKTLRSPLHFKIDGLVQGYVKTTFSKRMLDDAFYHVVLDDGRQGYSNAALASPMMTNVDPVAAAATAAAECKKRGEPRIGMTVKQLEATCWGKPDHINRRQTAKGTREQYVYGKNKKIDLHDGIVTSIDQGGANERRAH